MISTQEWVKDLLSKVLKKKVNNYSLEEQKVGTWIDGKPLYQKTIECTIPSNITGNYLTLTSLDIEIENIININGYIHYSDEYYIPLNMPKVTQTEYYCGVWANTNEVYIQTSSNYANSKAYITIQYTKTTD